MGAITMKFLILFILSNFILCPYFGIAETSVLKDDACMKSKELREWRKYCEIEELFFNCWQESKDFCVKATER